MPGPQPVKPDIIWHTRQVAQVSLPTRYLTAARGIYNAQRDDPVGDDDVDAGVGDRQALSGWRDRDHGALVRQGRVRADSGRTRPRSDDIRAWLRISPPARIPRVAEAGGERSTCGARERTRLRRSELCSRMAESNGLTAFSPERAACGISSSCSRKIWYSCFGFLLCSHVSLMTVSVVLFI